MTTIEMPFTIMLCAFEDGPTQASTGTVLVDPTEPRVALEQIWAWFNRGSGVEVEFSHRSLSVGDMIYLGETRWRCASVGWEVA